jgi:hypothetical protein
VRLGFCYEYDLGKGETDQKEFISRDLLRRFLEWQDVVQHTYLVTRTQAKKPGEMPECPENPLHNVPEFLVYLRTTSPPCPSSSPLPANSPPERFKNRTGLRYARSFTRN